MGRGAGVRRRRASRCWRAGFMLGPRRNCDQKQCQSKLPHKACRNRATHPLHWRLLLKVHRRSVRRSYRVDPCSACEWFRAVGEDHKTQRWALQSPKAASCGGETLSKPVRARNRFLPWTDNSAMKKNGKRALIEIGFIVFLFYSNLLMGEFERSGMGGKRGLAWALADVFTASNFEIAIVAATIGYLLIEFLRTRF